MSEKPPYKMAYDARKAERKGTGSVEVEGAIDMTKPKTFTDKNLDPKMGPGDSAEKVTHETAKPGGSISPEPKAPKQQSGGGTTKVDSMIRT
jgi:hypothetical protein